MHSDRRKDQRWNYLEFENQLTCREKCYLNDAFARKTDDIKYRKHS